MSSILHSLHCPIPELPTNPHHPTPPGCSGGIILNESAPLSCHSHPRTDLTFLHYQSGPRDVLLEEGWEIPSVCYREGTALAESVYLMAISNDDFYSVTLLPATAEVILACCYGIVSKYRLLVCPERKKTLSGVSIAVHKYYIT